MATPNFSKFSNNYTSTTINGSTVNSSNITSGNALTPTISIVEDKPLKVTGGLIADGIDVVETIKEQRIQIEALTDMINEMVENKDFNVKWNLEERVNHKKFLEKLGK